MGMSKVDPHKPFGIDLDPKKDLEHNPLPDGDVEVKHKGQNIDYMDYIDIMEERATRKGEGKNPLKSDIGMFSGFGKGTLNKPYLKASAVDRGQNKLRS